MRLVIFLLTVVFLAIDFSNFTFAATSPRVSASPSNPAPAAASADSATSSPQFSYVISNGVTLVRQPREPAACEPGIADGKITMNRKGQVCVCDGDARLWKTVGTGAACAW